MHTLSDIVASNSTPARGEGRDDDDNDDDPEPGPEGESWFAGGERRFATPLFYFVKKTMISHRLFDI